MTPVPVRRPRGFAPLEADRPRSAGWPIAPISHFRQKVTEAELDLAFDLLEKADRNLAADLGIYGIISGAAPTQHSPVPDLTVDLTAPARAYDNLGQRIFFGTGQVVDCSVDHAGIPTEVPVAGQERWLGVFLLGAALLHLPHPRPLHPNPSENSTDPSH